MALAVSRAKRTNCASCPYRLSEFAGCTTERPNQGHAKRGLEAIRVDAARAESDDAIGIGGVAD